MCGRYYIEQEEDLAEMRQILEEVNRRFQETEVIKAMRTGEIAPSHVVPALRLQQKDGARQVIADLFQWGYPRYQGSGLVINARSETAVEKPMFRQAVQNGRILLPANAFFEWQHNDASKKGVKMKLSLADEPTFYMAGLARFFKEPGPFGLRLLRFVILTTAANQSVLPIHDRMPLIVPRQSLRSWLEDDGVAARLLDEPVQQQLVATRAS
ncbi:MAG: SOS response-associated peptidase [Bacillota bacterium]|nr:SOS response-associated peptidase [Bacillota bacterium]